MTYKVETKRRRKLLSTMPTLRRLIHYLLKRGWWIPVLGCLLAIALYKYRLDVIIAYELVDVTGRGKDTLQYRLLTPVDQDFGKKYPLVVYLHGANSRGSDNKKQLRMLDTFLLDSTKRKQYPCYIFAPQCKSHPYSWDGMRDANSLLKSPLVDAEEIMVRLIQNNQIDTSRIYLVGYSMGGAGAWESMTAHPRRYAAAIVLSSWADTSCVGKLSHIPIWAFHGAQDQVVPVSSIRATVAVLEKSGAPVRYTEYPDEGHGCWKRAFRDTELLSWLFAQRR
jgi:predicted peptidase